MFRILLYAFLFYLLYKFVVDLVIPVGKASSQVRDQMRRMQEQQQAQQQQQQQYQHQQEQVRKNEDRKDGDYIDFEEVK